MRARAVLLGLLLAVVLAGPASTQQGGPHRAGLVLVHGDGRVLTACVEFDEETISGVELLRRSGLPTTLGVYGGMGYGVCAIDGEGCAEGESCFCQCEGGPCAYWVYSHRHPDSTWAISGVGANNWQLADGDVDGWVWGDGSTAPPRVDFVEVCPPEATVTPSATVPSAAASTVEVTPQPASTAAVPVDSAQPAGPGTRVSRFAFPPTYIVFGVIVLGLALALVFGLRRRR